MAALTKRACTLILPGPLVSGANGMTNHRTLERLNLPQRTITINAAVPFSLKATVLSHGWHECSPLSWSEGGDCFQMIERHRGQALRLSIKETRRTSAKVALRLVVDGENIEAKVVGWAAQRVRRTLALDLDLSEFYALCKKHPTLCIIPRIGAGRLIRSPSMAENIIKTICATNVNWTQSVKMINRLGQLGPPVRHFVHLNSWPTPREILKAGERYLKEVCRLGYRSALILKFCQSVCDRETDPEALFALGCSADVSSDDLLEHLRPIPGIGPSSAHFLLSTLGRFDRMSIDSATIAFVGRTHFNGRKPTPKQVERLYARFGKWKNLVWWLESWLTWGTGRAMAAQAVTRRRRSTNSFDVTAAGR